MNNLITTRIIWQLFHRSFQKQIAINFDKAFAKKVMKRAKSRYFNIVRKAPSVGKHNPKLIDILFTAFVASIYLSADGKISSEQMGPLMANGMESVYLFRKSVEMGDHFCKKWQDKRYSQSLFSQRKEYPADFVSEFVYGNSYDEYGINYSECALYKLLQREGCVELIPQICNFDYVMAKHMNAKLVRTKTLATGGDICDFWYTKMK